MNFQNFLRLLSSPKSYLSDLVELNTNRELKKLSKTDFLIPITETKEEDVFIVGYPKSGNTWMQSLIAGMLYGIDTEYMPDKLAQEIVPDVHARKFYKRFGTINFFKSHDLPQRHYRKVIYLVRDGRDSLVSYYHFNRKRGLETTLREMVIDGKDLYPSKWHKHVRLWFENPYDCEMITVRYEDLLLNPINELKRVCDFVGIERSEEILRKVVEGNHIDKMRVRVKETGGMGHKAWTGKQGAEFFRKGKSGSYKEEMNIELQEFFNHESAAELKMFNY